MKNEVVYKRNCHADRNFDFSTIRLAAFTTLEHFTEIWKKQTQAFSKLNGNAELAMKNTHC
jgi:hypothetical protein